MGDGGLASHENRIIQLEPNDQTTENPFPRNKIVTSKYTLWNFIPKNLFEQFRRVGNAYFLSIAVASLIVKDSGISPVTAWFPLSLVIMVTAIKQGYEDFQRYKADKEINDRLVKIIRRKKAMVIRCHQIEVGDIVRVERNDDMPCDIVVLLSSESSGECYVTTSNLDGEKNLKTLLAPRFLMDHEASDLQFLRATITCQEPMAGLYTFEGKLQAHFDNEPDRSGPLNIENIALRGSRLKDTDYIFGCAVYTGSDTKLSLNSKLCSNKFSSVEKSINKYVIVFIAVLMIEVAACTIAKIVIENDSQWNYYLGIPADKTVFNKLLDSILSFLIMLNYIVPISLYVTIELQQFIGSYFVIWDLEMYDEDTDQPSMVNSSDINGDLGQVEYLFSDKTGTLTENLMLFKRCFIDGHVYIEKDCDGNLYKVPPDGDEANAEKIDRWDRELWHFFLSLTLCHDVHIAPDPQKVMAEMRRKEFRKSFRLNRVRRVHSSLMMHPSLPEYEATSVDEKTLLEAAARCGIVYLGVKSSNMMEINIQGTMLYYTKLDILEFTSDRKRMSVLVKDTDGDIWLYCKGADSTVIPLIRHGDIASIQAHANEFSLRGYRTLVVGYKKFTPAEYGKIKAKLNEVRQTMGPLRATHVAQEYARVENGLTFLGVSAVEDRLQEGVPETIQKLNAAGIKVWILTGDKAETAENIAYFCGHFKRDAELIKLIDVDASHCSVTLINIERSMALQPSSQYGLLIDGASLATVMKNCPALFRKVAMACYAVACCRMSPLQKSEIVEMVKRAPGKPLTAAIGDGGNDVSMIKEAHVGFGIMGKEGRQAAMSADFAFSKFMHVERALLVHGHWYYVRAAMLTRFFFYKCLLFVLPQLFFVIHSGFSGQFLYDSVFLMGFNLLFSSIPILVYGVSEQDFTDEKLLANPQLYQLYKNNHLLSHEQFITWVLIAMWHSIIIYFIPYGFWIINPVNLYNSSPADHWCFSTIIFHLVTLVINLQLLILSKYWTAALLLSILFTELFFFVFAFIYTYWNVTLYYDGDLLGVFLILLRSPSFWVLTVLVVVVCLVPSIVLAIYESNKAAKLHGIFESGQENAREILHAPTQPTTSILPNRRSSTWLPWRKNVTFKENSIIS